MRSMVGASLLSLLLVLAVAQKPKPCTVPALMNGVFTVSAADGLISSSGKMSYDAIGSRMRVRQYGTVGNRTYAMDQLMLFNQKVYYEINWKRFSCKKKALDASFMPMQVPSDAKLMGQAFLGSSSSWGMGLLVNTWFGSLPRNGTYMSVFTEIGCVPVTIMGYTPDSGWTIISTANWVLGNTDPMDYFPPFFCKKSGLEESETPDNMFKAVASLARRTMKEE